MIAEVKLWGSTVGYLANDEDNTVPTIRVL